MEENKKPRKSSVIYVAGKQEEPRKKKIKPNYDKKYKKPRKPYKSKEERPEKVHHDITCKHYCMIEDEKGNRRYRCSAEMDMTFCSKACAYNSNFLSK